ncbi:inositol monophosphatase [Candidatus Woesearchaeota archaeon]|nr:inositol monophosphatase [Candidatus Woesearchaeota archaeon]
MNYLKDAEKAAELAENIVMSYFNKKKIIENKGEVDLVTDADKKAEKKILEFLKIRYPDHGFILEENKNQCEGCEYIWIIDPIDGTTSFAHNYPMFSISIALYKNNKPLAGVVKVPYLNELFTAQKNKGAYLNKKKIRVSKISTLRKSLIATGFPYTRIETDMDNLKYLSKMVKIAGGIRRSGSAAIDMCYVAAGRLDGYWELGLKIMDSAAAILIIKEAGGKVTDFSGIPIENDFSKIVASNSHIHEDLLKILKEGS